ncbi:putative intracellular protease/amidase [Parvularcula dongshanensis]|uniref:Putative intracellular protease/amidase n=1 Tax=Parvularcula dongshanensis TaxID=1173995 RepID=A0A840I4V9_9PROT|nr:putative intracellular protease/amidase [Parvularcula dongshanensis]
MTTTVVIPLYPGVTQLDFTGPHQFLARMPDAKVLVASRGGADIEADGLCFSRLADLEAIERCDVLCVPGGWGCVEAIEDERFLESVRRLAASARYPASVCTGSLILGAAGVLRGRRAACDWAWRPLLELFGAIPDAGRIVRDGDVFTGGGVTAGIDLSLAIVAALRGEEVAQAIQLGLEYAPAPPFDAGRPELAPPPVRAAVDAAMTGRLSAQHDRIARIAAALSPVAQAPS